MNKRLKQGMMALTVTGLLFSGGMVGAQDATGGTQDSVSGEQDGRSFTARGAR